MIVRESINESQNFERGGDPLTSLGIGQRAKIEAWLNDLDIREHCTISDNLIINAIGKIWIHDLPGNIPDYIQFGYCDDEFVITGCDNLTTLRGCPDRTYGNFECRRNKNLKTLDGCPKICKGNFDFEKNGFVPTMKDVQKVCNVKYDIIL